MAYIIKKTHRLKCARCNGVGKIVIVSSSNKMSTYKKQICNRCGGKGQFLIKL